MIAADLSRRAAVLAFASLVAACASTPSPANATRPLNQRLQPLSRFVGRWRGTGKGEPGNSTVERTYTPVLAGRFIEVRNTSTYAPQAANPKGEVHDDIGYLSFDNSRKLFVLRQFHTEGFVNQYAATTPDFTGNKLVFASEAFENIPASLKARESYTFTSADTFEEVFEIADDGVTFEVYSHNTLIRV
jgi:hypothetical protein